jgi:hypothetical protein
MAPTEEIGVLRHELPNASPTGPVRHKWGVWRDLMSGRTSQEKALLLREATLGFGDPVFQVRPRPLVGLAAAFPRGELMHERITGSFSGYSCSSGGLTGGEAPLVQQIDH